MIPSTFSFVLALVLASAGTDAAACNKNLLIDDFTRFPNFNNLNTWTSDDGTMSSVSATNGILSITPKFGGYFYETFPCQSAVSDGYDAVQFTVKGPVGGSFGLELQTQTSCSTNTQKHSWHTVKDLTGQTQIITIPWSTWSSANPDAINTLAWYGFSSNTAAFQLSEIQFRCSNSSTQVQVDASISASSEPKTSSSLFTSTLSLSSGLPSLRRSSSHSFSSSAGISSPVRSTLSAITSLSKDWSKVSSSTMSPISPQVSTLSTKFTSLGQATSSSSWRSFSRKASLSSKASHSSKAFKSSKASHLSRPTSSLRQSIPSSSRASVKSASTTQKSASVQSSMVPSRVSVSSSKSLPSSSGLIAMASTSASICKNLLIEDFTSQSRFKFLGYNALLQATYDDGTMESIVLDPAQGRATFTPKDWSYWYSQLKCTNTVNKYGGISMRIKAPAGSSMVVQLASLKQCGGNDYTRVDMSSQSLGWTSDGTEQLYSLKFSQFQGLDVSKVQTLLIAGFKDAITLGSISFFCGNTPSEYLGTSSSGNATAEATVAAPPGTADILLVDDFTNQHTNSLGQWHGGDQDSAFTWKSGSIQVTANNPDFAYYTQLGGSTCKDMTPYEGSYVHIKYSGSTTFTIALQQHNKKCDTSVAPFPETWDEVEASRYAINATDIYIPMSHFKIEKLRSVGFAFKAWYTAVPTLISRVEIVPAVPNTLRMPAKLPTGNLIFNCKRPNSFAFCIDDGTPQYAQRVMQMIADANIKVTFFAVGAPLMDPTNNLSNVYTDMIAKGHQLALHSFTHPRMESLPDYNAMDWEYESNIAVLKEQFGIESTYFRPPFGNEGARMRYRWTQAAGTEEASIVNWSVDVEDWKWGTSPTPERQLEAFKQSVDRGGNLAVLHYLYESTVDYLPEFIAYAKAAGKQIMRLDQCMEDPNAPPL